MIDSPSVPNPRTRRTARRLALALLLPLALASAAAQRLPELLPADVVMAVGLVDLEGQSERLRPFLDEAERLGLIDSLGAAVPDGAGEALGESGAPEIPDAFEDLELLDLLGREAWLAVSTSAFQPFPAVTLIARTSDAARDAFADAIADAASRPGTERRSEGDAPFYTWLPPTDGADPSGGGPDIPFAYAQSGELLVLSTDPETVRFVLRAQAGGSDPSLADTELYAALRGLGDGQAFGLLDAEPLTDALQPLVESFGGGALLSRLRAALVTAGPTVGVLRADDAGLAGSGLQLPRADGPDPALYALLTEGTAPDAGVLSWAPAEALSIAAGTADLSGWWAWLDDVLAAGAELGVPTASEAAQLVGVDVNAALLSWAGDRWVQIQTAPLAATAAGASDVPLLGEQVLMVASDDDAAARAGLRTLFTTLGATLAGFMSPGGQAMITPETVQVAGAEVLRLPLSETLVLDAAVLDGWAVFSGAPAATEAVLSARASGSDGPAGLVAAAGEVPAGARAWSLTDDRQATGGSTDALVSQLQMLAGLGGAATLDFDAVDDASEAVTAFAAFLAERLGTSRSVTTVEDGRIRSESRTDVSW